MKRTLVWLLALLLVGFCLGFDCGDDDDGFVHIVHYDATDSDVEYATNLNGVWQTFTIDSAGSVGFDLDIALDTQGAVHAFYSGEEAVWRAVFPVGLLPGR